MKKIYKSLILGLILLTFFSWTANAKVPRGVSGLFNMPTADVAAQGIVGMGLKLGDNNLVASLSYIPMNNVEVGVSAISMSNQSLRLAAFVKGQLLKETSRDPGLAVGINDQSAFVVFSKNIDTTLRAHLGIGTGTFDGFFGGISYVINPVVIAKPGGFIMPSITLIGEYDGMDFNTGLRLRFTEGITFDLYLKDLRDLEGGISWKSLF